MLERNYDIHGLVRRIPENTKPRTTYIECDIRDSRTLVDIIATNAYDEIYNFAAQSDAVISVEHPTLSLEVNFTAVAVICAAIVGTTTKLFQAGSVEIFKGLDRETIDESTLDAYPRNPYAVAKLGAYWLARYYREQRECYICTGIISNAESIRRAPKFVTRKIVLAVKESLADPNYVMEIGDLDACRDWVHARDVAKAAWLMLQQPHATDYIIGLGKLHSVRDFITLAFQHAGVHVTWQNTGMEEIGVDATCGRKLVVVDPKFFRRYEAHTKPICGDVRKLSGIGWVPDYELVDIIDELFDC